MRTPKACSVQPQFRLLGLDLCFLAHFNSGLKHSRHHSWEVRKDMRAHRAIIYDIKTASEYLFVLGSYNLVVDHLTLAEYHGQPGVAMICTAIWQWPIRLNYQGVVRLTRRQH